jgi:hypothetical protein
MFPEMEVYIPSATQHLCTLNFPHVIYGKVGLYRCTPIIFHRGAEPEVIHKHTIKITHSPNLNHKV